MIATGDFQYAKLCTEVLPAGKRHAFGAAKVTLRACQAWRPNGSSTQIIEMRWIR